MSYSLDESLIICQQLPPTQASEESASTSEILPLELFPLPKFEADPGQEQRISIADPTFMKTMEHSKFSSLPTTGQDHLHKHDYHMVKSTSSDTPMSLGTPVSASEVAAALLGASTSSLCGFRGRHRRIEEEDLSTPYNHYKCLSPKQRAGKLLRRQFSLDRAEDVQKETLSVVSYTVLAFKLLL